MRFGIPASATPRFGIRKGSGGWTTGPRGGTRKRVGGKWVYGKPGDIRSGGGQRKRALTKLAKRADPEAVRHWAATGRDFGLPATTTGAHSKVTGRDKYGAATRTYTKNRAKFHRGIVRKTVGGVRKAKGRPTAIVMMGGGGAGKGTLIKAVVGNHEDFVHVDSDEVKKQIPEYKDALTLGVVYGKPVTAMDAAWMAHDESSDVALHIENAAIANGQNVIIDGTGKTAEKHIDKINKLKNAGYHVRLMYAHPGDVEEAISRAMSRANRTGRLVPEPVLRDAHARIPVNFDRVAAHAHEYALYHTVRPDPRIVLSGGEGSPKTVHHEKDHLNFRLLVDKLSSKGQEEMQKSGEKAPDLPMAAMVKRIEKASHAPSEPPLEGGGRGDGYVVDVVPGYEKECLAELRKRQKEGLRP